MGFHTSVVSHITASVLAIVLNSLLFLGPLLYACFEEGYLEIDVRGSVTFHLSKLTSDMYTIIQSIPNIILNVPKWLISGETNRALLPDDLLAFRNYLVGPFTEEFVFRSCEFILLHYAGGLSPSWTVVTSSFLFGVAHCHHIVEHMIHGNMDVRQAIIQVLVQLTYTSLFAAYSGFVFIRTGSFWASFLMHAHCNYLGLPDFAGIFNHAQHSRILTGATLAGLISFLLLFGPITGVFRSMYYVE